MKKNLIRIMLLIITLTFMVVFSSTSCSALASNATTAETIAKTTVVETTDTKTMEETATEVFEAKSYSAILVGEMEVPAVTTEAMGSASFMLSDDMESMSYSIYVDGISDAQASHIHWAAEGENGPVVVNLFPTDQFSAVAGEKSGLLVQGTIAASDLVDQLAGMTLNDLIAGIMDGNAYVNIHTPANPGGEIRGQLK